MSGAGLIASLGGLVWAIKARRAAVAAESAAEAAERGAKEAASSIGRALSVVDLRKAIDLIQRLKDLHRQNRWEAAMEHYQPLREMLSSIIIRHADLEPGERARLFEARTMIAYMERQVDEALAYGKRVENPTAMNSQLNQIQSDLEDMAGAVGFGM